LNIVFRHREWERRFFVIKDFAIWLPYDINAKKHKHEGIDDVARNTINAVVDRTAVHFILIIEQFALYSRVFVHVYIIKHTSFLTYN